MNRRNFVVGLGTVATISGVASVTAAAFQSSVTPTTNFQIVPVNTELTVRRLEDEVNYVNLDDNASWNESEITDFGNVTSTQQSPVVAYINDTNNGQLGAQLAFNNTNGSSVGNDSYEEYTYDSGDSTQKWGFFEVANLGETTQNVSIKHNFNADRVGGSVDLSANPPVVATEGQISRMFQFQAEDSSVISPLGPSGTLPENDVSLDPGDVEIIGLRIVITDEVYENIQEGAGGAFSETESSIKLLDSIEIGTGENTIN